jgi:hypothetical protein
MDDGKEYPLFEMRHHVRVRQPFYTGAQQRVRWRRVGSEKFRADVRPQVLTGRAGAAREAAGPGV